MTEYAGPGIHSMTMAEYIEHPAVSRGALLKTLINPALGRGEKIADLVPTISLASPE